MWLQKSLIYQAEVMNIKKDNLWLRLYNHDNLFGEIK